MVLESVIAQVIDQQRNRLDLREAGLKRELIPATQNLSSHALIISGVRRCGKSTLLMQMMKKMHNKEVLYLNFETPHLVDFSINDFTRLDKIINKKAVKTLLFDELQLVEGWELYVRQKLDEGFRVIITGSNASLLGRELGTKLTGRHITQELYPFSYNEFITFKGLLPSEESLRAYILTGGFPEFVKTGDDEQLTELFNDVIIRDIVARYGIKDIRSIQRLATFLISNVGNRVTATKLKQPLSIAATSTILSWFSHLELSYLVTFLPMFSHSVKAQIINPRKVYAIDTGLVNAVSNTMTDDVGRKLENLVFIHLRKEFKEMFYFDDKGECDFVVMKKGKVIKLVQVCYELTPDNLKRELNGLLQAMRFFNIKAATIVTFNNSDLIKTEGFEIEVIPAYQYLSKKL
jgi:predicted AAA+ superfamily ATPase